MYDERIDIENFADRLTREVNRKVNDKKMIKEKFLRKLHSMLRTKGLSLFDFFMRLDVNRSATLRGPSKSKDLSEIMCPGALQGLREESVSQTPGGESQSTPSKMTVRDKVSKFNKFQSNTS